MIWRFYINDIEIEEPAGFTDVVINIQRDEQWKGVFFEASTSSLQFHGNAFDILKDLKDGQGLFAVAIFRAELRCEGEDEYTEVIRGKLNFGQYKESCGDRCMITLPVEQDDCTMIMRNRYDQKVNIDSNIAFDKQTVLQNYDGLGFTMELAPQEVPVSAEGYVQDDEPFQIDLLVQPNQNQLLVRPVYSREVDASLTTANLSAPASFFEIIPGDFLLTPQLLLDTAAISCFDGDYDVDIRLKGRFRFDPIDGDVLLYTVVGRIGYWDGTGDITTNLVVLEEQTIITGAAEGVWYPFDLSYTASTALPFEVGVYAYIDIRITNGPLGIDQKRITVDFDNETVFSVSAPRLCPATDVQAYMIHETISRTVEAITNVCLTAKSDYYGRTDSEPYAAAQDGCGSLRILTNGLKIRQAENNNLSLSLKDIFEGLNPIDNIGMGIEQDGIRQVLRVEAAEYFYNNTQVLQIDSIPDSLRQVVESRAFSVIKTGYKKWETESVKGLDEFNSNKEFRTGLDTVNNTLDITSAFIAAGYVIEQARTQLFVTTGRADSKYDNDTFIICVERQEGYIPFRVEQGNIDSATGIFSPATAYNWRIRPMYNLMRWAKSILQVYPNINDTAAKLFFSSGTGNYVAAGELSDPDLCKLENQPIAENSDLHASMFADTPEPILAIDDESFEYPLSVADYKKIKANPYGFINLQCGGGEFIKAYINSIEYTPNSGKATFNLSIKWV